MILLFLISTSLMLFLFILISYLQFEKSAYKKLSNVSYWKIYFNTGLYGEYLIVNELEKIPGVHKTLINLYIPKENSNETTEIDILFIHENGIYVIESKNYSGWIFGRETDYKWTQVFPNKKKFKFYNPVKQNRTHIKALQNVLPEQSKDIFTSIIVFSNRCTLKSLEITSSNLYVINRKDLSIISKINAHNYQKGVPVFSIYGKLLQYTNASEKLKKEHIANIERKLS